ncbi:citrate lyase subunit beta / citryl-CoA lyase [Paenibacillus sp. yr247]|uniref:HpcH/HpaI aldolase/citrate lyase family protein n=1 Tax=Paenibacillus sp. yr247 TaxID=1761880 RepID=UPI000889E74D|nr:CoA ester lyase [Paenibacillus sp. yr247]SDO49502.1 citrate lyase subunit beta / citryl-CoA lyase [Paenibacillus sp. yr247]
METKFVRNRVEKVRRSTLIVPGNVERFIQKAMTRGADAIQLDLEDSVPYEQKDIGRQMVLETLNTLPLSPTEINVRINNEPDMWLKDLTCCVAPRLHSVTIPKCEDTTIIREVEAKLADLERERGLLEGHTQISILIESALGLSRLDELLGASDRISTVTLGNEDFCLDLGIEASSTGEELYPYYAQVVLQARIHQVMPLGFVSSIADFRNLDNFRRLAEKSKQLGFMGSSCIHPDQVAILNEVYTPRPDELERALGIVQAFEQAQQEGRSSCSYMGKMIDPPVYLRAQLLLKRNTTMMSKG